jgi:hypothetical protein
LPADKLGLVTARDDRDQADLDADARDRAALHATASSAATNAASLQTHLGKRFSVLVRRTGRRRQHASQSSKNRLPSSPATSNVAPQRAAISRSHQAPREPATVV